MSDFNLIDEPWIPCVEDGKAVELGLRDTLRRAGQIDSLAGLSPPASVALHRLLLALMQRIYQPMNEKRWQELWRAGSFGEEADTYLDAWHQRFNLFDPERPFYQVANLPFERYERPAVNLSLEWGAGNQKLFSHAPEEYPFTPAEAARHLLTFQAFSPGGTITHEEGERADKYADAAPLNRGAVALVQGDSLLETLLLNTIDYDPGRTVGYISDADDAPAWEGDGVVEPTERTPRGLLDWLTWQARRVRLHPVREGGELVVRQAVAMKGFQLPAGVYAHDYEPMVAYRELRKAKPGENPYVPVGFSPQRALWRDSLVLFESVGGKQPKTLRQLGNRRVHGPLVWPLTLSGIAGERATVTLWRQESLPLPMPFLEDSDLLTPLKAAVRVTEGVGAGLRDATQALASWLVAPDQNLAEGRKPDAKAVAALRDQLGVEESFWPQLERPFVTYLVQQAESGYDYEPVWGWACTVFTAARRNLAATIDALDPDARSIRAGIEAMARLNWKLGVISREEELPHEHANAS